jgi:ABC-type nickel/cobalt efflux system permease component RcnA
MKTTTPISAALILMLLLMLSPCLVNASPFKAQPTIHEQQEPGLREKVLQQINATQLKIRQEVTVAAKQLRDEQESNAILLLAALSFVYGLVHALGPGHGKSIVMSCMLAESRPTLLRGALTGVLIAFGEVLAAILVVVAVYHFAVGKLSSFFATDSGISHLAYTIIFVVGALLLISRTKKHLPLLRGKQQVDKERQAIARSYPVALPLGMIPCPGVLILLSFMFTLKMPWIGILLAIAMALGMAVTISSFALFVVFFKNRSLRNLGDNQQRLQNVEATLEILGATLITVVGFSLAFLY